MGSGNSLARNAEKTIKLDRSVNYCSPRKWLRILPSATACQKRLGYRLQLEKYRIQFDEPNL